MNEVTAKKKILVVEDDEISRDVLILFLKHLFDIDEARNAQTALEKADSNQYDLVLMDVNLGRGLTGLDITKNLKQRPNYANVPIIAITAFAMKGDKEEFLQAGFDHYLAKPFTREELRAIIKKFMPQ
ncbi:MAG: NarL family signal transduction histidine kinase [Ignavibacteria bacterium]|nr:MAG: NarL family signal transduction histidine kinase [Ignavibacteria bacterium]KAF0159121.1 MAG: NarL family signal transduction histidine kinase [Ignavibacteria bacterium]